MGGPTFFLYLPKLLTDEDKEAINVGIVERALEVPLRQGIRWEFHFAHKEPCTVTVAIVPFGAESAGDGTATEIYLDDDERLMYETILGYCPVESIQFDCYCYTDAKEDHKALARFAAQLARKHNGVLDVDWSIRHVVQKGEIKRGKYYIRTHSGMDGNSVDTYLVDADFMDEWIEHPDFYLQK